MFNSFQTKIITSAILATFMGLTACSNSETQETVTASDKADTVASENESAETSVDTKSVEADPQEKLNAYIECSNGTISDLNKSFNRYDLWVEDMDGGPSGHDTHVYGLYDLNESGVDACTTKAAAAVKMAPSIPDLDNAASAYIIAIKEYDDVSRKAAKYYDQGNYKDDNFALGKELHPQLVSAFEKADQASQTFDAQLETLNSKIQNKRLAELEKTEGRKFSYLSLATTLKAKDMVDYITQDTFDVGKANTLIADYETLSSELTAYIETDAEDLPMNTSLVSTHMENLLIASKERMRHVRDDKTYTQAEIGLINNGSGWMVEGSPDKLIQSYNKFVDTMNRLR